MLEWNPKGPRCCPREASHKGYRGLPSWGLVQRPQISSARTIHICPPFLSCMRPKSESMCPLTSTSFPSQEGQYRTLDLNYLGFKSSFSIMSCKTMAKWLPHPVPQFLTCKLEVIVVPTTKGWQRKLNEAKYEHIWELCPLCSNYCHYHHPHHYQSNAGHAEEKTTEKCWESVIHSNCRDEVGLREKGIFEPDFKGWLRFQQLRMWREGIPGWGQEWSK